MRKRLPRLIGIAVLTLAGVFFWLTKDSGSVASRIPMFQGKRPVHGRVFEAWPWYDPRTPAPMILEQTFEFHEPFPAVVDRMNREVQDTSWRPGKQRYFGRYIDPSRYGKEFRVWVVERSPMLTTVNVTETWHESPWDKVTGWFKR